MYVFISIDYYNATNVEETFYDLIRGMKFRNYLEYFD